MWHMLLSPFGRACTAGHYAALDDIVGDEYCYLGLIDLQGTVMRAGGRGHACMHVTYPVGVRPGLRLRLVLKLSSCQR